MIWFKIVRIVRVQCLSLIFTTQRSTKYSRRNVSDLIKRVPWSWSPSLQNYLDLGLNILRKVIVMS